MVASSVVVTARGPSTLFSPSNHRASKSKRNVLAVAHAVKRVMQRELGAEALARWTDCLDTEIGEPLFGPLKQTPKTRPMPVAPSSPGAYDAPTPTPSLECWMPPKPKVTALLLDAFAHGDEVLPDGLPITIGAQSVDGSEMSKMMGK